MYPEDIKRMDGALRLAEICTTLHQEGKSISFSIKKEVVNTLSIIFNMVVDGKELDCLILIEPIIVEIKKKLADIHEYIHNVPQEYQVQESYVRETQLIVNLLCRIIKAGE